MNNSILAFQAKSFFEVYQIIKQQEAKLALPRYFPALIVNGAFSAELALKSILTENCVNYKKEHNLVSLFMLLPREFSLEVFNRSMSIAPAYGESDKWADELNLISEAFVDWRYCYEVSAPATDLAFLDSFVCAVYETLISHYNVEITESSNREKTDSEIDEMFSENRRRSKDEILNKLARKRK